MGSAVVTGTRVAATPRRSLRDTLLLTAAAVLTGSGLFALISDILSLVDSLQSSYDSATLKVASGMDLLTGVLELAAFAVAIAAFAAVASARRAGLLTLAFAFFAAGAFANLVSDLLSTVEYGTDHATGTYVAHYAVASAADISLVAAAVVGALAVGRSGRPTGRRNGWLGWASVIFAIPRLHTQ